jgi:hypothetical protein
LNISSIAILDSFSLWQIYTPLPDAKLSALITLGYLEFSKNFFASNLFSSTANLAVGILYSSQSVFVKIFDPSS